MSVNEQELQAEILQLKEEIEEYKDLIEGIRNGGVDALAINKNGHADIFSLESSDFVYRVLVENFPEGALNVSDKGIIVYANPAFERLVNAGSSTIVGMDVLSLVEKQSKFTFEKLFRDAFSGNSTGELTLEFMEKQIQVEISLSSLYPRFHGIAILIKDLSERKRKEDQLLGYKKQIIEQEEQLLESKILQRSIDKFRSMGDTVPQKVWTAEPSGDLDYFNKKWFEYSSLSADALKGKGWLQLVHADDLAETVKVWQHSISTGKVYETEHRLLNHKDEYRWHLSRAVAQHNENGDIIQWVGTTTDVHQQKNFTNELEEKVNEAKVFLKTIFDSSEEVIASLDQKLVITSINKVGSDAFGLVAGEIVGKSLLELFPELKDGSYQKMLMDVLEGKVVHQTESLIINDQEAVFDAYFKPLVINKTVKGIVVIARDITQVTSVTRNLQQTKKQLQEQYQKIERKNKELVASNAELMSFNYIATHDLQEPLRKIILFSARISEGSKNVTESARVDLERISSAATHMKNLLNALLSYSQINHDSHTFEQHDLNILLSAIRIQMISMYPERQPDIIFSGLPVLSVIPHQVGQLFTNLISNSIKYCETNVTPRIEITAALRQTADLPLTPLSDAKTHWELKVSDNGIGFDQKYEQKIFELFQRLHSRENFDGTGIGLAICRKIVQNHQGMINATGEAGKGSTFTIYLPVTEV